MITISAKLDSILGGTALGGYLRITLCGFGNTVPVVPGTGVIADAGVPQIVGPQTGSGPLTQQVWGNDVITPVNTFYEVAVLDQNRNVVSCAAYQFTGSGTIDLSTATPFDPAAPPLVASNYIVVTPSANPAFAPTYQSLITIFDLTLTGDVASSTLSTFQRGSLIQFIVSQDSVGGHNFAWPSNVKNPPVVSLDPSVTTTQLFIVKADLNLYPVGPAWS